MNYFLVLVSMIHDLHPTHNIFSWEIHKMVKSIGYVYIFNQVLLEDPHSKQFEIIETPQKTEHTI